MNENTNETQLDLESLNILHLDSTEVTENNLQELINNSEVDDYVNKAINNFNTFDIAINSILSTWHSKQEADNKQRGRYGTILLLILGFQLIFINCIVVAIGLGVLRYDEWLATIFIGSVFVEVIGLVTIIVKSLFQSNNGTELNEIIKLILESRNSDKQTN